MGTKLTEHDLVASLKKLADELGRTPTLREFASVHSRRQIDKYGHNNLVRMAGLETNKSAHDSEPVQVTIRPPKILVFDIECTGMVIKSYGLYNQNHNHKDIIEDWSMLSYAAWFVDEEKIHYLDNRYSADYRDDRQIIEGLNHLISQADWIIGHNSDKFDIKKFNAKAEKYNLGPRPPSTQYDTIKMLKARYALASYSLDYAARYFELKERKSLHGKFPGKTLFDECKKGNLDAWAECEAYNTQDVRVTWELFQRLAKHDNRINLDAFYQEKTCICGNKEFYKNGLKYNRNGAFQMWRCTQCQKVFVDKSNLIDKDARKTFSK